MFAAIYTPQETDRSVELDLDCLDLPFNTIILYELEEKRMLNRILDWFPIRRTL